MNEIIIGIEYGIDFFDEAGDLIRTLNFKTMQARDQLLAALGRDENHPEWPTTAVRLIEWHRNITRPAVKGIDYGPGSIKARYGRAPRGAYEFRG